MINARELPQNPVLVVRIDETPEREGIRHKKERRGTIPSKGEIPTVQYDNVYVELRLSQVQWYTTNKGEAWGNWPPEYYTKGWRCTSSYGPCTSYTGLQTRNVPDCEDYWSPGMYSDADMNKHYIDISPLLVWYGTTNIRKFRVEWMESDAPGGDDDFLDRYTPFRDEHGVFIWSDGPYNLDAATGILIGP